ncbi:MAG: DUF177 domain-containing protein [Rhodospirillales bacterium]|nr:DUF177 domain-containing protein [Rhodospirillales bacterium]
MTPEFSRPERMARPPEEVRVEANAAECAALARRFGLPAIAALACRFRLAAAAKGAVRAEGELAAVVSQVCVVTGEVFETPVAERFVVRFVPAGTEDPEPDLADDDEIPCAGETMDLGEAAAEQLALALDPYPRAPGVARPGGS